MLTVRNLLELLMVWKNKANKRRRLLWLLVLLFSSVGFGAKLGINWERDREGQRVKKTAKIQYKNENVVAVLRLWTELGRSQRRSLNFWEKVFFYMWSESQQEI